MITSTYTTKDTSERSAHRAPFKSFIFTSFIFTKLINSLQDFYQKTTDEVEIIPLLMFVEWLPAELKIEADLHFKNAINTDNQVTDM